MGYEVGGQAGVEQIWSPERCSAVVLRFRRQSYEFGHVHAKSHTSRMG